MNVFFHNTFGTKLTPNGNGSCKKKESGHFQFLKKPFRLKNEPTTFQRLMNTVLNGLIGKGCIVYLDDIIIFTMSLQEQIESLDKV